MAIYLGDNPAQPYRGDHKPVSIYHGSRKVAGYKSETKTGPTVEHDQTYNHHYDQISVQGGTVQAAEYYQAGGASSQVQMIQGKNLFDKNKGYILDQIISDAGIIRSDVGIVWCDWLIKITPSTQYVYRANAAINAEYIRVNRFVEYDASGNFLRRISNMENPALYTSSGDAQYIRLLLRWLVISPLGVDEIKAADIQLELGSAATAYEPFVPNSPSPDYPAPITPYMPAGTYRLPGTSYEVTIPDLHGVGSAVDKVIWDRLSGIAWIEQSCGGKVLDGTIPPVEHNWRPDPNNATYAVGYAYNVLDNAATPNHLIPPLLCSNIRAEQYNALYNYAIGVGVYSTSSYSLFLRVPKTVAGDTASLNAWLSANPMTIVYQRATPVRTELTLVHAPGSTAPELPMAFFSPELGPDYPQELHHKGDNNLVVRGRNLIDTLSYGFQNPSSGISALTNGVHVLTKTADAAGSTIFFYLDRNNHIYPPGTYTLSFNVETNRNTTPNRVHFYFFRAQSSSVYQSADVLHGKAMRTFAIDEHFNLAAFYLAAGDNVGSYYKIWNIQLEPGEEAHPYAPYHPPQNIPVPILRGVNDTNDTYDVLTGELIRRIDPDIDNCTTQDITDPAVLAAYTLDPPISDPQPPRQIATHYPYTRIDQDGDNPAVIAATCLVMDD